MRIDESNYKILDRVLHLTGTNYNIKWFDAENVNGYIDGDDLIEMIEDLIGEIDRLEEEKEDIIQDRDDNWKRVSIEEQIGYSERW